MANELDTILAEQSLISAIKLNELDMIYDGLAYVSLCL